MILKQCIAHFILCVLVFVQKEGFCEKYSREKYRSLNTTTGSWCFLSLSVEKIRHESPVSSSNAMYCFHISSQCLCFGSLPIKHSEMFKMNCGRQKQFQTCCHSIINSVENGFPKGQKYTISTKDKWRNHMNAKVNVYNHSAVKRQRTWKSECAVFTSNTFQDKTFS